MQQYHRKDQAHADTNRSIADNSGPSGISRPAVMPSIPNNTAQLITMEPVQLQRNFSNRYVSSGKLNHRIKKQQDKQREQWETNEPRRTKRKAKRKAQRAEKKSRQEEQKRQNIKNRNKFLGLGDKNAWKEIIDGRHHHLGENTFDEALHLINDKGQLDNDENEDMHHLIDGHQSDEENDHVEPGGDDIPVEHFGDEEEEEDLREPGYLNSMLKARKFVADTMGQKMDDKYLEQIHLRSASHKKNGPDYHSGYRNENDTEVSVSYDAGDDYQKGDPSAALEELDPEITRAFHTEGYKFSDSNEDDNIGENAPETHGEHNDLNLWFKTKTAQQVRAEVNKIMKDYYTTITTAATRQEKLLVVSTIHRRLENLHPFIDANTRTNRLVLHRMLVENGMSPVILDNPLEVHLKSNEEWAEYLEGGMAKWEQARKEK